MVSGDWSGGGGGTGGGWGGGGGGGSGERVKEEEGSHKEYFALIKKLLAYAPSQ